MFCERETFLSRRKRSENPTTGEEGHQHRPSVGYGSASNHHALAAQLLAELGKSEMGRGVCLEKEVAVDLERALQQQVSSPILGEHV